MSQTIRTIAVVGAGVIGASWTSLYLAHGYRVTICDPRPEAEAELKRYVTAAWGDLGQLMDLTATPPFDNCQFFDSVAKACTGADMVQECGPDRIGPKQDLVAEIEAVLGQDVVIASSTSSLLASDIQAKAQHPDRILVAHPMNPPHLVPLVELVGGGRTAPEALDLAEQFYKSIGRVTIRVKKERVGHLANRLTSALYREAVNIVAEGIGSVEDVDKAIAWGPGMRWAFMGPHLIYHLGGGPGGYRHYLEHLGPTQEVRWQDLGTPSLTPDVVADLLEGLAQEMREVDTDELTTARDKALVALAKLKSDFPV